MKNLIVFAIIAILLAACGAPVPPELESVRLNEDTIQVVFNNGVTNADCLQMRTDDDTIVINKVCGRGKTTVEIAYSETTLVQPGMTVKLCGYVCSESVTVEGPAVSLVYPPIVKLGEMFTVEWDCGDGAQTVTFETWTDEVLANEGKISFSSPVKAGVYHGTLYCNYDNRRYPTTININVVEPLQFSADYWWENAVLVSNNGRFEELGANWTSNGNVCKWKSSYDEPHQKIVAMGSDANGNAKFIFFEFVDGVAYAANGENYTSKPGEAFVLFVTNGIERGSVVVNVCEDGLRFHTTPEAK